MSRSLLQDQRKRAPSLNVIINHPVTDLLVILLISASVFLLILQETLPDYRRNIVTRLSDAITLLFVVELSLRLVAAKKKSRFFLRYWPDILAILPLFRPFRVIRFVRLFRLFRLFQLGYLLDRRFSVLRGVLRVNFYLLWVLLVVTTILIIGGGVMAFMFERGGGPGFSSFASSLWWAAHTIVGQEPIGGMPATAAGKALLVFMMLSGMGLFATFTGIVSATIINRLQGGQRMAELDIDELENHIVVCGYNDGVRALLGEIAVDQELRTEAVVLVNARTEIPDASVFGIRPDLLYHLVGDHTQLRVLEQAGIKRASRAIVVADAIGDGRYENRDARSVLAALTIERMNPQIHCVVELMRSENQQHLAVAGVEAVLMRNDLSGRALASACRHPGIMNVMMNLITQREGQTIHRFPGPRASTPFGELLGQLKAQENAILIGVEKDGRRVLNPGAAEVVEPGDQLLVIS